MFCALLTLWNIAILLSTIHSYTPTSYIPVPYQYTVIEKGSSGGQVFLEYRAGQSRLIREVARALCIVF